MTGHPYISKRDLLCFFTKKSSNQVHGIEDFSPVLDEEGEQCVIITPQYYQCAEDKYQAIGSSKQYSYKMPRKCIALCIDII